MKILITGGAGFIGSHAVRHFVTKYPDYQIYNLDALTYAGNLENVADVQHKPNYHFLKADINDEKHIRTLFKQHAFDAVIHFAAESHVDRSILSPDDFLKTNLLGTAHLLNAFIEVHKENFDGKLFYQISTDEVYGSLGNTGYFTENSPYAPRSPYAASKAAADHLVRAYGNTYEMPFILSNCSNNYGPYQFPEKLIPLVINNIKNNKEIPVYGDGSHIRDWLYVHDHILAIDEIFHRGKRGDTYLIGGNNEKTNLELVQILCDITDDYLGNPGGTSRKLIRFVADRKGHDTRYAVDISKISGELGWKPEVSLSEGLQHTVHWYCKHTEWLEHVTSGAYRDYYRKMYE